jgi:serine/threonine protein kinase/tetratricopeptide (TPR) repeat protein
MEPKPQQDDELIIDLVEQALAQPASEREAYLESACAGNSELLEQARNYVRWEERMNGFLLEPIYRPGEFEHPFEPGQLLDDRFRIVRELARGGMGIVYEAMDEKLDRRIAIKCAKAGFRKRLPPEVRNAREISHPNVCKIFEIHTASTRRREIDFIAMEFLEGETLAERLRRGPMPQKEAHTVARQLAAGLAEAHRNRVIHGDLKSSNIILTTGADGAIRAVITDFGLARVSAHVDSVPLDLPVEAPKIELRPEDSTKTMHSGGGTPAYMAPELWRGEKASVASDIYALGVILYELAAGRRPFARNVTWQEKLTQSPPPIDRKWDPIVARCLDSDPARRCQNADEVAKALAPRSRRWWLAAAAALVLAIGSAAVTYQRATAPQQTIRLAVLPFGPADLSRDTAKQLARLKGNSRTGLKVIPLSDTVKRKVNTSQDARALLGATHVLRCTVEKENENIILHVYLTDTRSGIDAKDWKVRYAPTELRYAPVALAGFVTSTFELPPLVAKTTVNAAARPDYLTGMSYVGDNIRLDESVSLLERAVAADPDSPLTYAGLAEAQTGKYRATGDLALKEKARESVRQAQLRNPDLAEVHLISGWLSFISSLNELAQSDYQRAIALQPNNSEAYRRISMVYYRNGQMNEALTAAQKAVEIQPDITNLQHLGGFYFLRGDFQNAITEYRKMIDLAPKSARSHYALGAALGQLGRSEEAEHELRTAISLHDDFAAEHTLGAILLDSGKNQEAIYCFRRALDIGPASGLLWLNLGLAYSREHRDRDARSAFFGGQAFELKGLAGNSRHPLERARLAYFAARLGDSQQAESEIAQALQSLRDDAEVSLLALLTFEALGHREQSLSLLTGSPSILLRSIVVQVNRYPELAELRHEPRYLTLIDSNHIRQ